MMSLTRRILKFEFSRAISSSPFGLVEPFSSAFIKDGAKFKSRSGFKLDLRKLYSLLCEHCICLMCIEMRIKISQRREDFFKVQTSD